MDSAIEDRYSVNISAVTSVEPRSTTEPGSPILVPPLGLHKHNSAFLETHLNPLLISCAAVQVANGNTSFSICLGEKMGDNSYRKTIVDAISSIEELLPMDHNSRMPINTIFHQIILMNAAKHI